MYGAGISRPPSGFPFDGNPARAPPSEKYKVAEAGPTLLPARSGSTEPASGGRSAVSAGAACSFVATRSGMRAAAPAPTVSNGVIKHAHGC